MPPLGVAAALEDVVVLSSSTSGGGGGEDGEEVSAGVAAAKTTDNGAGKRAKKKQQQQKNKSGEAYDEEEEEKKKPRKEGRNAGSVVANASCSFPMSRVWRLVRSEGGNTTTTAATRTTPDAIFLINKASEMFLENIAEDAFCNAMKRRKKGVNYENLASTVHDVKRYEFLSDFVPEKLKAEDALKARASVET